MSLDVCPPVPAFQPTLSEGERSPAARRLGRQPLVTSGALQQIRASCREAGLFLVAMAVIGAMALAIAVLAPYFFLRLWFLPRRVDGCRFCRSGLPQARKTCPGCGRGC